MKILYPTSPTKLKYNPYPLMVVKITDSEFTGYTVLIISNNGNCSINTYDTYSDYEDLLIERLLKDYRLVEYGNIFDAMEGAKEYYSLMEYHTEMNRILTEELSIPCMNDMEREEIELEYLYDEYLQQIEYEQQACLNGREDNRAL